MDKGEKTEKQQPARKRKKEDVKVSTPSKNPPPNENAKVDEGANKKRKVINFNIILWEFTFNVILKEVIVYAIFAIYDS